MYQTITPCKRITSNGGNIFLNYWIQGKKKLWQENPALKYFMKIFKKVWIGQI